MAVDIEQNQCNCLDTLKKLAGKVHYVLDHNCDGKLDTSDIYNSALCAYENLTGMSLSDINEMKLELYRKAIVYMKAELKE